MSEAQQVTPSGRAVPEQNVDQAPASGTATWLATGLDRHRPSCPMGAYPLHAPVAGDDDGGCLRGLP